MRKLDFIPMSTAKCLEYQTWLGIKKRCYNPNSKAFRYYGARGVTMSDEWRDSFKTFYTDMGKRPFIGATIDRIDNKKGYSKENCRWLSRKENSQHQDSFKLSKEIADNIRDEYIPHVVTAKQLARKYGVYHSTIKKIVQNKIWRD